MWCRKRDIPAYVPIVFAINLDRFPQILIAVDIPVVMGFRDEMTHAIHSCSIGLYHFNQGFRQTQKAGDLHPTSPRPLSS